MHRAPQATPDGIRLLEKFRGDVGETKKAPTLEVKPGSGLTERAIQDSNLWPSAPEALGQGWQPDAGVGKSLQLLASVPAGGPGPMQAEAGFGTDCAPAVPPDLLTVRDAARRLRVCTAAVYRACKSGELSHSRVGSAIRIAEADLAAYVARGRRS